MYMDIENIIRNNKIYTYCSVYCLVDYSSLQVTIVTLKVQLLTFPEDRESTLMM